MPRKSSRIRSRRRRYYRRRRMTPKFSKFSNAKIYNFKRTVESVFSLNWNNLSTFSSGALSFHLSDLPSSSEFTALFDKYRISAVKVRFYPRINQQLLSSLSATVPTGIVPLVTVIDYDDSNPPSTLSEMMQYENFRVHDQFKPFTIFLRPQIAVATYSGSFTSYGSSRKMWIDAGSPSVEYYGVKIGCQNYSSASSTTYDPAWDVFSTFYVQCKYPR